MKLIFHVDYRTSWGESVYIYGNIPALGNDDVDKALKLSISDSEHWTIALDLPDDVRNFEYR